ncbi:hypothetical protein HN695_02120 [Candidatus Woesearchaeota archaeon]|jgi:hypothetical protein|nr:hypothetical protein [Candidatus Woesearchaeota archaeon]MBT5272883.1 hypothetical protein [Candidatus Woesearchaeota archaeon]MBT6041349.1 hypothetical protein [Candidatus Woesearchaeota archaeon]MBT6337232.1 hypothetical protein [Candidatus Woesearchaeota archaeon]MBT7927109.1 hypothetical protein [Candidatus Woesearchaeota archaeon]
MWSTEEVGRYEPRSYEPLTRLYDKYHLSRESPWERAEFLAENVLSLTMTDHDFLMRDAGANGRAHALNMLEDMVIAGHGKLMEEIKIDIPVPIVLPSEQKR